MIKFGMSIAEMIAQLTRGFTKQTGRLPSGLEKIKIQQEALQKAKDMNKVLDMKGNPIDPDKPIMGGEQSQNLSGEITSVPNRPGQSGLSYETRNKEAIQRLKDKMKKDPEEFAYGGVAGLLGERTGFAGGGMGRRGFLKFLAGAGAGIGALKSGIFGLGKKTAVKEAVKQTAGSGTPPPYFFKLVEKIKMLGDDATSKYATKDREVVTKYKDFELTEDITTGRTTIQRYRQSEVDYYDDMLMEETYMDYIPGKNLADETTKGKNIPDEYTEDTSFMRTSGPEKGDIIDTVSGVSDDIFEEVGEAVPEAMRKAKETLDKDFIYTGSNAIKKADGGRIGYAAGKGVTSLLNLVKKKFGKKSITTADKIPTPRATLDRDMFKKFDDRNPDPKRQMTSDELEDFEMEIGPDQLEGYDFDGTVGDAQRILKEDKAYEAEMYQQYKMGKLDPVAGDKSPARKRFLEQKLADMEASGDSRLMTREEIEELTFFDLGTKMDNAKLSVNDEIKQGVAEIMSDTSPAALQKSIEIDNLMLKYPGMDKNLAEQIATEINPRKKADIIAMVEQTFKMSEQGMSGDDIIQTFKNTPRTKQASGGIAHMLGE
jgi:hypothetical protein